MREVANYCKDELIAEAFWVEFEGFGGNPLFPLSLET